jgi:hypothetical protein
MRKRYRTFILLLSVLVLGMAISQCVPCLGQPERPRRPFGWDISPEELERLRALLPYYLTAKAIIDTINSVLILGIVAIHINIYRRTGTKFSLGLVLFSTAFLLYTVVANPLVHRLLGFRRIGFGPLFIIPDLLTLIASAVLIYLSRQ